MYLPKNGDKVLFGRSQGERTKGTVVKVNSKTAKVRQDEQRGAQKAHPIGTVWTVPFNLLSSDPAATGNKGTVVTEGANAGVPATVVDRLENPADAPLPTLFLSHVDRTIIEAIDAIYSELSPENLTCDGELPRSRVQQKYRDLQNKLQLMFRALGRPVSETAVFNWSEERRNMDEKRHAEIAKEAMA